MCGFAGFIDFHGRAEKETLRRMGDVIRHRGPDDEGLELFEEPGYQVGFSFRRLSIIDLSALGHQPMFSADRRLVLMFNGEIYNFRAVRDELVQHGHSFRSHSDSEVILAAFQQWGPLCVNRFIGMFAITIYDQRERKLFLMRDRAGVKPLFYYWNSKQFIFGSELKSFHQHPSFAAAMDVNSLSLYFQHGYVPAPHTIYKSTYKLEPGHYLTFDLSTRSLNISSYWDVFSLYNRERLNISYQDALDQLDELLKDAFQFRMVADVPVGIFLSGGYDSSAVTAILQKNSSRKIKTFTIGFKEQEFNEAEYAKKVADHLGTDHYEYTCTYKEALDLIPKLPDVYDEPFGDSSAIPTMLVSKVARQQVTVALSADGGDEIFCGYPKYFKSHKLLQVLEKIPAPLRKAAAALLSSTASGGNNVGTALRWKKLLQILPKSDAATMFDIITKPITFSQTKQLLRETPLYLHSQFDNGPLLDHHNDNLSVFQAIEFKTYMVDDILQKVDRATMAYSLEGREPFLDQRIVDFAARLPTEFKYRNGSGKVILKDLVHRYIPREIMERPKMGFGVPIGKWCRNELKGLIEDYLSEERVKREGVLHPVAVKQLKDAYFKGATKDFQPLWFVLVFQMWRERWQ